MKESYIEGIANHNGLESCAGARKGTGEALTEVRMGGAIEPRKSETQGADAVHSGGRQHHRSQYLASAKVDPARSKNSEARTQILMYENREIPQFPFPSGMGRGGKAKAVTLR